MVYSMVFYQDFKMMVPETLLRGPLIRFKGLLF